MKDKEIVKALEYAKEMEMEDVVIYYEDVCTLLDIINRLQAENEWLTKCRKEEVEKLMSATDKVILETKAEAYKEFWNCRPPRLNEQFVDNEEYNKGWNACLDEFWNIRNNLLKELVGDN